MRQNTSHFGVNTAQDDSVLYRLANPADSHRVLSEIIKDLACLHSHPLHAVLERGQHDSDTSQHTLKLLARQQHTAEQIRDTTFLWF